MERGLEPTLSRVEPLLLAAVIDHLNHIFGGVAKVLPATPSPLCFLLPLLCFTVPMKFYFLLDCLPLLGCKGIT